MWPTFYLLEAECCPQVYGPVSGCTVDDSELLAKDVHRGHRSARSAAWACLRIAERPSGMIQDIVKASKEFQSRTLHDVERFSDGHIPLEGILVANIQLLSKTPGRSIR